MFTTYNTFFETHKLTKANAPYTHKDMIEDTWTDNHIGMTEMRDFSSRIICGPILKENPIDKRIKQVRNNVVTLIKICNLKIDDEQKFAKINAWVLDAKRCDIKAACVSNNNMRKYYKVFAKSTNHYADDEVLEIFFNAYAYPPLNCKWYEKILCCKELSDVFYIARYIDVWTKTSLGL